MLGLALDGDADRVIAVDEHGEIVDGDQIMAALALDLARARAAAQRRDRGHGDVEPRAAPRAGRGRHRVVETPVGDRNVLAALEEHDLVLGGEQSGHVIFRDLATTGDGVLTGFVALRPRAALGPAALGARGADGALPAGARRACRWRGCPTSIGAGAVRTRSRRSRPALGDDGRVLVRASGTEPRRAGDGRGADARPRLEAAVARLRRAVEAAFAR